QFQPEEPLTPGTAFEASFDIGEVMTMPEELETFSFGFQTIPQTFDVTLDGLHTYDVRNLTLQKLHGSLSTADVAENAEVEKVLSATQDGKNLRISWIHDQDRRTHFFHIDSLARKEAKG